MRVDSSYAALPPIPTPHVDQSTLLAWLLYAGVGVVLLLLSAFLVIYFQPKNAAATTLPAFAGASTISAAPLQVTSRFVNVVCIFAINVSLLCLFTAPLDVYLLENSLPHVHANGQALKILYQVYFGCLAAYSFIGAPLVYNYARQTEIAHITMLFSAKQRLVVALKRTLCFLLGLSLLLVMAMVILQCGKPTSADIDWLRPLLNLTSDLGAFFRLVVGILVLSGMYLWIFVCGRGLASVPLVGLLMENHGVNETENTFQDLLRENAMETQATDQTKETILKRYAMEQQMSRMDQDRLEQLKMREQLLKDRRAVLEANLRRFTVRGRWSCWRVPIGVLLLLLSLLVLVSMLITSADKVFHSSFRKGYLLNSPKFPNPMDGLLVIASHFFPLDYVLFGVLFLYLFLVSFIVLVRHGVRFLCFRLDRLQPRLTSASTMAIVALVFIYIAIVGLFSTLTLAPQYATFGHQQYADETTGVVLPCTLEEAARSEAHPELPRHCRMSQLAHFYNTLSVTTPVFGCAFFLGQLLFIFSFVPWFAHAYYMAKPMPDDPKRERLLNDYE
ncbi:hypothetical protein Poli38472_008922 [Pythium oligandrum]|uniref:Lysosomal cobalamin transporter n=1 Tax=Pythium oligandrum TaxID=41045 RepID=A0A8K1C4C0_PYTOL|nr:hypothetical protein Poli38472_008922 [Pythium oligandrum]|eukprot:TMW56274.1 hypothetical protein Poli38472_008922 [Pythium oligandrum]